MMNIREQQLREELSGMKSLNESIKQGLIQRYGKRLLNRVLGSEEVATATIIPMVKEEMPIREMPIRTRAKITASTDVDVQIKVDAYIQLHEQYKLLESQLKSLKEDLEPYMKENNLRELPGIEGGKIQIVTQDRAPQTAQFTTYNVEDIEQVLTPALVRKCTVRKVDRDILEALIQMKDVPEEIHELRQTTPTTYFTVKK